MNKEGQEKLNEVLNLSSKILKVLYVLILIVGFWLISKTWELWGISRFIKIVIELFSPLFIGFIIAYLFNPVVTKFHRKGVKRVFSAIIIYILFLISVYFMFTALFPLIIEQVNDLIVIGPKFLTGFEDILDKVLSVFNNSSMNVDKIKDGALLGITDYINGASNSMPAATINIIKNLFSSIGIFIIGLFIGFYLLVDFEESTKTLGNLIPKKIRKPAFELLSRINVSVFAFVKGMFFIFIVMLIVGTIAFSCIGLKGAFILGLFNAITNIIPYVGPYIGGLPIIVIGFSYGVQTGILTTIVVVIIQFLESYILNPIIMSKTMKLHPVTIMLGLLIFGYFFGIIGMVLATPVIAILKIIIKFVEEQYEKKSLKIKK